MTSIDDRRMALGRLGQNLAAFFEDPDAARDLLIDIGFSPGTLRGSSAVQITRRAFSDLAKSRPDIIVSRTEALREALETNGYDLESIRPDLDAVDATLDSEPRGPDAYAPSAGSRGIEGRALTDADWQGGVAPTREKLMGARSTLLPINFLRKGLQSAGPVVRVLIGDEAGTGFVVEGGMLVTNNHVLPDAETASRAVVQFGYETRLSGRDSNAVDAALAPHQGFITSAEHDWSVTWLADDPTDKWGALSLRPVQLTEGMRVNIIQHPGGGPKQLALYHNLVTYHDDNMLQYFTDTLPGSSGSPVFDSDWTVVGLHRSGGWVVDPGTKQSVYRNEGTNINQVLVGVNELRTAGRRG